MSPNALVPCDGCTRHVRRAEARCPFCGLASPHAAAAAVTPEPAARLSRAGILAFVATVGAGACSSAQPTPTTVYEAPPAPENTPPTADAGAVATPGTPPGPVTAAEVSDASATATAPPSRPPGSMMMRYGSPPRP